MWAYGLAASLAATCSSGLGDNLIKLSYHQEGKLDKGEDEEPTPLCKRPLWIFGWFLSAAVDTGLNALALYLASLELVMPLGGMHILWGALFAHVINKESVGFVGWFGAFLIVGGVAMVLASAPRESDLTYEQSTALLESTKFAVIMSIYAVLILGSFYLTHFSRWTGIKEYAAPALAGFAGANSNFMLKFVETLFTSVGGAAPDGSKYHYDWHLIVSCILLLAFGATQLTSLNYALKHFEACTVVAVANSVMMLGGTLYGLLCYSNGSDPLTTLAYILLSIGVVLVIIGIFLLSNRKRFQSVPDATSSDASSAISDVEGPANSNPHHTDYGTMGENGYPSTATPIERGIAPHKSTCSAISNTDV